MSATLKTIIKVIISIGLIVFLLRGADFSRIGQILSQASWGYLLAGLLLCFLGYFITATRWRQLMTTLGHKPKILYLVRSFTVSMFFNNFLPSTIGGDVSRMYDTWKISGDKAKSIAVIFLDRFFGVYALFIYAALGFWAYQEKIHISGLKWLIALGVVGATTFLVMLISGQFFTKKIMKLLGFLPEKIFLFLERLLSALHECVASRAVIIKALLLSFVLQINVVIYYYLITKGLHIDVPLVGLFMIIPVALIVMMIPISVNGIGLREAVFVVLLGIFGVTKEQALAFSFVVFILILIQGVIGGIVYMTRRREESKVQS